MAVRITSRVLPGVGVSQDVTVSDGRTIGVVTHRDGGHDIVVHDGERLQVSVTLTDDEADALAELLGAPKLVARLAALQHEADALLVEQVFVPPGSPYAGRPLADTRGRAHTGASIVAVTRGGATQPSPGPDFVLEAGDLVLAVGTREGLDQTGRILDGTG